MAGRVKHTKLFDVMASADTTLLGVLMRLKTRNTDGLIGGIADAMRDRGIELLNSTAFLTPLLAADGVPRAATERGGAGGPAIGYRIADIVAGLDIGQTIAVKSAAVVAVEAMEGTDADRARRPARRARRLRRQGGETEPGHALRRAGRRRVDDRDDEGGRARRCR